MVEARELLFKVEAGKVEAIFDFLTEAGYFAHEPEHDAQEEEEVLDESTDVAMASIEDAEGYRLPV